MELINILVRVFVDDFTNGIAGPPDRPNKAKEKLWFARAILHAIHSIFPPPDVLNHEGGKDSVSEKKLKKGDACFKLEETLIGFNPHGGAGRARTISLPLDKKDKYVGHVTGLIAKHAVSLSTYQGVHGKLQHAASVMPCMRGFMTPLNRALANLPPTIGIAKNSSLRETLTAFIPMLENAHTRPSHITELVPPDLPHVYGYVDFAACGFGGVWLPSTKHIPPIVWRLKSPPDIEKSVQLENGHINNNDGEAGAVFIAELMLDHLLYGRTAGVSSYLGSDNSSTTHWNQRKATRSTHKAPERFLRWQAMHQRWTRRGPADVEHVAGKSNLFGDFPSRSFEEGFSDDSAFIEEFSRRHPLPPQLGSWQLVHPTPEIISATFLILRNQNDTTTHPATATGASGLHLPTMLASTLFSLESRAPPDTWNEATCSWPLLSQSGEVNSTMASRFAARPSRKRYVIAPGAWSREDLQTLDAEILGN